MKLEELKSRIIIEIGDMYDVSFDQEIDKCKNVWDILFVLEEYGYDKQGSLDIIFSIVIDQSKLFMYIHVNQKIKK